MVSLATDIVAVALAAVGNTAGDGEYEALIASGESESVQRDMGRASGCGLVVRGLWRRWLEALGLPVPASLRAPYAPGSVLGTLLGIARRAGAVQDPGVEPQPGDVVWLGDPEHVELVVDEAWRVAGGQRNAAGLETVLCVRRSLSHAMPLVGDAPDPPAEPSIVLPPRRVLRALSWDVIADYLARGGS